MVELARISIRPPTHSLNPFRSCVAFGRSSGGHLEDVPNAMQDRNDVYFSLTTACTCLGIGTIDPEKKFCILSYSKRVVERNRKCLS